MDPDYKPPGWFTGGNEIISKEEYLKTLDHSEVAALEKEQKRKSRKKVMVIQAEAAGYDGGNFVKIQINGQNVDLKPSETCGMDGLHIVVIDKTNGDIVCKAVFDVKISLLH